MDSLVHQCRGTSKNPHPTHKPELGRALVGILFQSRMGALGLRRKNSKKTSDPGCFQWRRTGQGAVGFVIFCRPLVGVFFRRFTGGLVLRGAVPSWVVVEQVP